LDANPRSWFLADPHSVPTWKKKKKKKLSACHGEGSAVGPLLAARALRLAGGERAASTVLSSALLAI
jgi:hypothetical protein